MSSKESKHFEVFFDNLNGHRNQGLRDHLTGMIFQLKNNISLEGIGSWSTLLLLGRQTRTVPRLGWAGDDPHTWMVELGGLFGNGVFRIV